MLNKYRKLLSQRDDDCCNASKSLLIYPNLLHSPSAQSFICQRGPLYFKRIFSQIRLLNRHVTYIYVKKKKFEFSNHFDLCRFCKLGIDDFYHTLIVCPMYNWPSSKYFLIPEDIDPTSYWLSVLSSNDFNIVQKFVTIITEILNLREYYYFDTNVQYMRILICSELPLYSLKFRPSHRNSK